MRVRSRWPIRGVRALRAEGLQVRGHVPRTFWPWDENSLGEEPRAALEIAQAASLAPNLGTPPSPCGRFSESISTSGYGAFRPGVSPESRQPNQAAHLFSATFSQLPELTALVLKDRAGPVDLAPFTGSLVRPLPSSC